MPIREKESSTASFEWPHTIADFNAILLQVSMQFYLKFKSIGGVLR